jgi:hypothetical protein
MNWAWLSAELRVECPRTCRNVLPRLDILSLHLRSGRLVGIEAFASLDSSAGSGSHAKLRRLTLTLFLRVSSLSDPVIQNQLVVRLNISEVDAHPFVLSSINDPTQTFEVLTSVGYLYSDLCPRR